MKYFYEKDICELVNESEVNYLFAHSTPINVRFCRDCPKFDINGIQPDPGITRGLCLRFSDEHVPYYVRVKDSDFCNEDNIGDQNGQYFYLTYNYIFSNMV